MKRLVALTIVFCLLIINTTFLISCKTDLPYDDDPPANQEQENTNQESATIVIPEYKDYQRATINFSEIVYKRPNIENAISIAKDLCSMIEKNEIPFNEQADAIFDFDDEVINIRTMAAFANIQNKKDSSVEFWNEENKYITTAYASFIQAAEQIYVKAANSPHAELFEEECFGDGLIEKYKDGGKYTDNAVVLMADEAELESEYSSLSTSSIVVVYNGEEDTVDNIIEGYRQKYGDGSTEYLRAKTVCNELYQEKYDEMCAQITTDLFRVRRLISDELGYSSYRDFAYETIYHDYDYKDAEQFISDINEYIVPVYAKLAYFAFNSFNKTEIADPLGRVELINTVYSMLDKTDPQLFEIYSYMLQHELFDIEEADANRFGSFTTYLDEYNAPFLFVSTTGSITDYITLCHEFGHFADFYINNNSTTSLDLSEVSSQALELLALTRLKGVISEQALTYLIYYEMQNSMLTLISNGFYAAFEHMAYELPYDQISEESLSEIVSAAAEMMSLNSSYFDGLEDVNIPHIILYPFYVQSYCTSLAVSLEIFFLEDGEAGEGFSAYKRLIDRGDTDKTFEEYIEDARLTSPFEKNALKKLAEAIHYKILGSRYFTDASIAPVAA